MLYACLPGVDGLALRVFGDLEQMGHLEVGFGSCGRTHHESLVHHFWVLGKLVCLRIHSHSLNSESMGRAGNATGNLASVCNQKFSKHLVLVGIWMVC